MHPSSYLLYMNHTHNTKMKNLQMIILLNEFIVQNVPSYDLSVKKNNLYIYNYDSTLLISRASYSLTL